MSLRFRIPNGAEIRELRRKAGMTQADLAKKAGMSQSMIARIESGSVDPRLSTLKKVLGALESIEPPRIVAKDVMTQPVISVNPNQTIHEVIHILQNTGFSQIPVLEEGNSVGSLEESALLAHVSFENPRAFLKKQVREVMVEPFPSVPADIHVDRVYQLLASGYPAVLVVEGGVVVGIICKIDVIGIVHEKQSGTGHLRE